MERDHVIVLDTHVWVWWISGAEKLPARTTRYIEDGMSKATVYVSSISVWEVAQLTGRGRLHLTMDVADWVAQSEALPFLHFVPVDNHIALKSIQLPPPLHHDPADRIIIATALSLGALLITKDDKIAAYPHVKTQW